MPSEHLERRFERRSLVNEPMVYGVQSDPLIISEAARKPGAHAERLAPNQPWGDIRSIGNVLRHQYDDVRPEVVGWIVQRDLAELNAAAPQALLDLSLGQAEGKPSEPQHMSAERPGRQVPCADTLSDLYAPDLRAPQWSP